MRSKAEVPNFLVPRRPDVTLAQRACPTFGISAACPDFGVKKWRCLRA